MILSYIEKIRHRESIIKDYLYSRFWSGRAHRHHLPPSVPGELRPGDRMLCQGEPPQTRLYYFPGNFQRAGYIFLDNFNSTWGRLYGVQLYPGIPGVLSKCISWMILPKQQPPPPPASPPMPGILWFVDFSLQRRHIEKFYSGFIWFVPRV